MNPNTGIESRNATNNTIGPSGRRMPNRTSNDGPHISEVVHARGHENVRATHASTFEITTDDFLTPAGDCIIGIDADRAPTDFDPAFVTACRRTETTIIATLRIDDHEQAIRGRGNPGLSFESDRSLVCRTSDYVDNRTVMVGADHAAGDLKRNLVDALTRGGRLELELELELELGNWNSTVDGNNRTKA